MSINNLLRYPGGKTRAIKILDKYYKEYFINTKYIYSPFFGGGSFEIYLNNTYNVDIYANDKYELLINFWENVQINKNILVDEINKHINITKEKFIEIKNKINIETNNIKKASYFYIINRCSFSGSTLSGGFSNEASKKRFTPKSINNIKNIDLSTIYFSNSDFSDFLDILDDDNDSMLFLDPPYYLEKSNLYGVNGDLHKNFDHIELYNKLINKKRWMLCYNNSDYIKNLYKNYIIIDLDWNYGMNKSKKSSEILIISK